MGIPGQSAREEYERRRARDLARWRARRPWRIAALFGVWIGTYVVVIAITDGTLEFQGFGRTSAPLFATLACVRVAADIYRPKSTTEAFRIGAEGEERIGAILERFSRRGWIVLHDLALPAGGNIDHLVITPGGVFTVETKNYSGTVHLEHRRLHVNGRRKEEHLEQAARQAEYVRALLANDERLRNVTVRPIVCYARAKVKIGFRGGGTLRGIGVGTPSYALRMIGKSATGLRFDDLARMRGLLA